MMAKRGAERETARQRAKFLRIRNAHRCETAESYVALIDILVTEKGVARLVDLSRRFGVAHATVNKTVQRLERDGLIVREPYGPLFLTDPGKEMAARVHRRHEIVRAFLLQLGVPPDTADADAEGFEHHISPATLEAFERWTAKLDRRDN
jgi:DtxR family manganese transport transcriptional regulator